MFNRYASELLSWAFSVLDHWGVLVTGGLVTALITVLQWRQQKSIPWTAARRIMAAFLFVAFFLAWRDQYERADQLDSKTRNSQNTTNVINVPPAQVIFPKEPPHTHVRFLSPMTHPANWLPFREGETVELNVIFTPAGAFEVKEPRLGARIGLVSVKDIINAFEILGHSITFPTNRGAPLLPNVNDQQFLAVSGPTLTAPDVTDLLNRQKVLCAVAKVRWLDETGQYETRFGQCYAAETPGQAAVGFNWHLLPENNNEYKLP